MQSMLSYKFPILIAQYNNKSVSIQNYLVYLKTKIFKKKITPVKMSSDEESELTTALEKFLHIEFFIFGPIDLRFWEILLQDDF